MYSPTHHRDGHSPQGLPHPGRQLRPAACPVALRGHPLRAGRQHARRADGNGGHRRSGQPAATWTTQRVPSGTCGTRSAPRSPCPRSASRPTRSITPPTSSSGAADQSATGRPRLRPRGTGRRLRRWTVPHVPFRDQRLPNQKDDHVQDDRGRPDRPGRVPSRDNPRTTAAPGDVRPRPVPPRLRQGDAAHRP